MAIKYLGQTGLEHLISKIKAALAGKVSTAAGMGLSHNDFTDTYKQKLDGISPGANAYSLPTASGSVKGGIKVGSNLSMSGETLSATDTRYNAATTSAAGLMSAADKQKLNGIAAGANAYSLPTASGSVKGGIKVGSNLSMSGETLSATDTRYSNATTSAAGLMSAADKQKLDGISPGAGGYTLPTASASVKGGIKVGSNLSMSGETLNATDTRYNAATTSAAGLMSAADKQKLDGIFDLLLKLPVIWKDGGEVAVNQANFYTEIARITKAELLGSYTWPSDRSVTILAMANILLNATSTSKAEDCGFRLTWHRTSDTYDRIIFAQAANFTISSGSPSNFAMAGMVRLSAADMAKGTWYLTVDAFTHIAGRVHRANNFGAGIWKD